MQPVNFRQCVFGIKEVHKFTRHDRSTNRLVGKTTAHSAVSIEFNFAFDVAVVVTFRNYNMSDVINLF